MKNWSIFSRFALPLLLLALLAGTGFAQLAEPPQPGPSDWLPAAFTVLMTLLAGGLVLVHRNVLKKMEALKHDLAKAKQELRQVDQLRLELSKARQRRVQFEEECKRLELKVAVLEKEKQKLTAQIVSFPGPAAVQRPMPTTPAPPLPPTPSPPPAAPPKLTPPPIPVPTFFLPLPNPDGSFADERATTFNPAESLYRFRLDKNPLEATFEFADDPATVAAALRYPDNCLAPVCEYGTVEYAARRIQTVSSGRARLSRADAGRWELVSKAVIRFV